MQKKKSEYLLAALKNIEIYFIYKTYWKILLQQILEVQHIYLYEIKET